MWVCATPATQNERGCEIVPRLSHKVPRRHGRPNQTAEPRGTVSNCLGYRGCCFRSIHEYCEQLTVLATGESMIDFAGVLFHPVFTSWKSSFKRDAWRKSKNKKQTSFNNEMGPWEPSCFAAKPWIMSDSCLLLPSQWYPVLSCLISRYCDALRLVPIYIYLHRFTWIHMETSHQKPKLCPACEEWANMERKIIKYNNNDQSITFYSVLLRDCPGDPAQSSWIFQAFCHGGPASSCCACDIRYPLAGTPRSPAPLLQANGKTD